MKKLFLEWNFKSFFQEPKAKSFEARQIKRGFDTYIKRKGIMYYMFYKKNNEKI